MRTYLFVWNPIRWPWDDIEENIAEVDLTGKCSESWSCGNTKSIAVGDRIFLVKLGTEPKGVIGAGFATSKPFKGPHWSEDPYKEALYINIDFEVLLNPEKESILRLEILKSGNLANQTWLPQASGISIKEELVGELEAVWFDFLNKGEIRHNPFLPTENGMQKTYTEGTPNQVVITKYERNPEARRRCLRYYGYSCVLCNFNFEKTYGEIGKEFIHVHHIQQLSVNGRFESDPVVDLRPVCPNCHAMIHKRLPAFSMDEMATFLRSSRI